jgi:prepilin-type N-terminal cleavage/methylation domain-containing protein
MTTIKQQTRGFTLIEMMIIVAVVGLLAAISVPTMVRARDVSQSAVMYNDMRVAGAAFELYAMEQGDYPPNAGPGVIPVGMAEYLGDFAWTEKNSVNGSWNWDFDRHGFRAAVSVTDHTAEPEAMLALDKRVDDGDLSTGCFRSRPGGYSYVLE